MAIALRSLGQVQVWSATPSSTFTVPKPAGLVAGDLMLACVVTNGVLINLPTGWTDLYNLVATTNPNQRVFYKIADASDAAATDFTFTTSAATYGSAEIGAYSGVDQATPIDFTCTPVESSTNTATFTVPAGTVVTAGAALVGGAAANTGVSSSSWTLPSGPDTWTEEWNPTTGAGGAVSASGGKSHIRGNCIPAPDLAAGASTGAMTFTLSVSRAGDAWVVGLRPDAGGGGGAPTPVLNSRIVGVGDGPTSARVNVRTTNATFARLQVATDAAMTTGVVEGANVAPDVDGNAHLTVSGLTAGTKYFYRIIMTDGDAVEHTDTESTQGVLKTAPSGAASFSLCFGSCTDATDSTAMAQMAARGDDLFLHLGDLYYADGSGTSLANFQSKMLAKITAANHADLFATTPVVYTPSDHDGMNNNSTAGSDPTAWTNWNTAYHDYFPTPTIPSDGCYFTFVWGRVRFIVLDTSSYKSDPSVADNASKTCLGTVQKQWVKDTVNAATEPLIVLVNAQPWVGSAIAGDDSWLGFTTERTEMATFFAGTGKNFLLTGGDQHCLAADNGTNSPGGIPIVHAAPFNNTASRKGGPYSAGQYPASGSALVEQFGRLSFTDDGTDLFVSFNGYDSTDTVQLSMSLGPYSSSTPAAAGSASGTFAFTGAADGTAPAVGAASGAASGAFSWTGGASGTAPTLGAQEGAASGSYAFSGVAEGSIVVSGDASGSYAWNGAATGPLNPGGAEGAYSWVGAAEGSKPLIRFTPPTHEEPIRTHVRPLNFYRLTWAASVVRVDGVLKTVRTPSAEMIAAAGIEGQDWFRGGHIYEIDDALAYELSAAGFLELT